MQPSCGGFELRPALEASNQHLLVRGHRALCLQAWLMAAATRGSALSFAAMSGAAPGATFVTHPAATYPVQNRAKIAPLLPADTAGAADTEGSSSDASDDDEDMKQEWREWRTRMRKVCTL